MCGATPANGSSSGNGYLVRCLTDEWLRQFDTRLNVGVVAMVNDVMAVDGAVRRRFAFVIEVGDEMTPDMERLAWTSLLGMEPPAAWRPCAAAVADVALAAARCRMLGLNEPRVPRPPDRVGVGREARAWKPARSHAVAQGPPLTWFVSSQV